MTKSSPTLTAVDDKRALVRESDFFPRGPDYLLPRGPDYLPVNSVPTDRMSPPTALRGRGRNTVFGGWRGLGRFWAIVIAVTGSAVALLEAMGPPPVERELRPVAATAEGQEPSALPPVQPPNPVQSQSREAAPDAIATKVSRDNPKAGLPTSVVPSLNNLPSPTPLAAKQNADNPQNPPVATAPSVIAERLPETTESPEPQHTTGMAADPPPTQAEAAISETGKPALRIYYSFESPLAAKNAQSLVTRIGAELMRSDFKAESDLPKHAAIRISEERNHALARTIAQSLGDLGYGWEIENLSGLTQSRRNVIEVWLPAK
jgi:hypothetical protein